MVDPQGCLQPLSFKNFHTILSSPQTSFWRGSLGFKMDYPQGGLQHQSSKPSSPSLPILIFGGATWVSRWIICQSVRPSVCHARVEFSARVSFSMKVGKTLESNMPIQDETFRMDTSFGQNYPLRSFRKTGQLQQQHNMLSCR